MTVTAPLRILLVDDQYSQFEMIRDMLLLTPTERLELDWAETYDAGLARLAAGSYDVCLVDYQLGEANGLDFIRAVRSRDDDVSLILVTGHDGEQIDLEAIRAGATDYLSKAELRPRMLERSIRYAVERARSDRALRASETRFRALIEHSYDVIVLLNSDGEITYVSPTAQRITGYTDSDLVGNHLCDDLTDLIHPDDRRTLRQNFTRLLHADRTDIVVTRARLRRVDGAWLWLEGLGTNLLNDGSVEAVVINIRDITESMQALQAEHEQRMLAEALLDTSAALNSTLQFDSVIDRILTNVSNVIVHNGVNLMLIEDGITRVVGCNGYESPTLERAARESALVVAETASLRRMVATREPLVIPDVRDFPGWIKTSDVMLSYIGLPIITGDAVIGFLNLDSSTAGFFAPEDARRLQVFADQAALAIQNARIYEQAHELAAARERQRLARDLHDAVSQTLFSASVIAESLPRLLDIDVAEVRSGLHRLTRLTKGALAEMRALLIELRPSDMVEIDLGTLLDHLCGSFRSRTDTPITLTNDGPAFSLPVEPKIALYRITQEALNNVIKHARASTVAVQLEWGPGMVTLRISDDGVGFDLAGVRAGHVGLRIMDERASMADIKLVMTSQPGAGTMILARWQERETDE